MSNFIRELRERLHLNQADLGKQVNVTRQTISAWEKGEREPSMAQYAKLARALDVSMDVVIGYNPTNSEELGLLYRSDKKGGALQPIERHMIQRKIEDYVLLERELHIPPVIPASHHMADMDFERVEQIAQETRDWLGVEDTPLGDAIALLERKNLKILRERLRENIVGFSAYTEEWGGVIVVNTHGENGEKLPYERQVFTALHELGHLIFHRAEYRNPKPYEGKKKDPREKVANHFASAVLIPAEALRDDLRNYRNSWLPEPLLIDLRERYGASVRTLLMRAGYLKIIKEYGKQLGWLNKTYCDNHGEPPQNISSYTRKSRLEILTYTALLHEKISESKAAEILSCSLQTIRDELSKWLPQDEED